MTPSLTEIQDLTESAASKVARSFGAAHSGVCINSPLSAVAIIQLREIKHVFIGCSSLIWFGCVFMAARKPRFHVPCLNIVKVLSKCKFFSQMISQIIQ